VVGGRKAITGVEAGDLEGSLKAFGCCLTVFDIIRSKPFNKGIAELQLSKRDNLFVAIDSARGLKAGRGAPTRPPSISTFAKLKFSRRCTSAFLSVFELNIKALSSEAKEGS
jgi:hypothetical protein